MRILRLVLGVILLVFLAWRLVPAGVSNLLARETVELYIAGHGGLMQSAQVAGGPSPSEVKSNLSIANAISLLKRVPAFHAAIPERAFGEYLLANNEPEQAINWLESYCLQHPADIIARLTLGNAHYMLRHGAKSADQYKYVLDRFEEICCDPQFEGSVRQQWNEVRRRILEADLLDAYVQVQTAPDSAARQLESCRN